MATNCYTIINITPNGFLPEISIWVTDLGEEPAGFVIFAAAAADGPIYPAPTDAWNHDGGGSKLGETCMGHERGGTDDSAE